MHPFDEYDLECEAKAKAEIAAEKAAWDALPQAERDRIMADRQARLEAFFDAPDSDDDDDDDEDEA